MGMDFLKGWEAGHLRHGARWLVGPKVVGRGFFSVGWSVSGRQSIDV